VNRPHWPLWGVCLYQAKMQWLQLTLLCMPSVSLLCPIFCTREPSFDKLQFLHKHKEKGYTPSWFINTDGYWNVIDGSMCKQERWCSYMCVQHTELARAEVKRVT
jgi:hypothetical protein